MKRQQLKRIGALVAVAFLTLATGGSAAFGPNADAAGSATSSSFTASKVVTRTNWENNADVPVDSRHVSVTVSDTKDLRDRQGIEVTWSGAHPTGGLVTDHNSGAAAFEEYPFILMECRGVDDPTAPASKQVSPETCWTQTPDERFQFSGSGFIFTPYRMDRYASTEDRAITVNQPNPLPAACPEQPVAHWVPFVASNGTVYPGGRLGCAGLAPEAANSADSLQPGNTTYGVTGQDGTGQARFVIQNADSNASLGCSVTVACTLEVIPVMGISCDPSGNVPGQDLGLAPADRPDPNDTDTLNVIRHGTDSGQGCENTGRFQPGEINGGSSPSDQAVSGALWWSASNWRNRIAVPLTFAVSSSVCDIVSKQATLLLYGSEAMSQAMQQWARSFCTNSQLFNVRHVQTSEPQAKNLLALNNIQAAIQGSPPTTPFTGPVVQAPAAVTGWTIGYSIDGADGKPYQNLKLTPRLLAKLLTESYFGCAGCFDFDDNDAKQTGFIAMKDNPIDMSRDPEFKALNPGIPESNYLPAAASLAIMSSDSDVLYALTSYINADPEARAWLNGQPDPWGMVVNPAYKGIQLPVVNWPLLDTHIAKLGAGSNTCLERNPTAWLPLVAAPVLNPSIVALNMQFDIANSQTACQASTLKETAIGREAEGSRFLLGLVSLADAERYQIPNALLQTTSTTTGTGPFPTVNRAFVGPTDAALRSAALMFKADDAAGSWTVPYDTMRTSSAGKGAYPGVLLMSFDVPTHGLPAGDAGRFGTLLHFAAGQGQAEGLGNGQLPPGYLPMTVANGLGSLAAYTNLAAGAVAAQNCATLYPSGKASTFALCPSTGGNPGSGTGTPTGGDTSTPNETPSSTPSSGSPAPTKTTTKPSSTPAVPVAETKKLTTGPFGLALPVALLLAVAFLGTFAWRMGIGRR